MTALGGNVARDKSPDAARKTMTPRLQATVSPFSGSQGDGVAP